MMRLCVCDQVCVVFTREIFWDLRGDPAHAHTCCCQFGLTGTAQTDAALELASAQLLDARQLLPCPAAAGVRVRSAAVQPPADTRTFFVCVCVHNVTTYATHSHKHKLSCTLARTRAHISRARRSSLATASRSSSRRPSRCCAAQTRARRCRSSRRARASRASSRSRCKKVKKLIFCTGKASTPARGRVSMCAHGAAPTGVLRAAARARSGEARRGHRDRPRGAAFAVPLRSRDGGGGAVPGREGCLGAGACAAAAVLVSVRVAARLCVEVP
jgi:hypothetical protein